VIVSKFIGMEVAPETALETVATAIATGMEVAPETALETVTGRLRALNPKP
jgi:hypothetical protein